MKKSKNTKTIPGSVFNERMRQQIELEVISSNARLLLTRLLRAKTKPLISNEDSHQFEIIRQNRIINIANTVLGRPIYVLNLLDWDYDPTEYAWHRGEFELLMRRPDSAQLIEIVADLIVDGALHDSDVNEIFEADGCGIRLDHREAKVHVEIVDVADLPSSDVSADEHQNVRRLFDRLERAMQDEDWSLVLHTAASIFETVAKQVVPNQSVQNQSLGGWLSLYRKHSKLAEPMLDIVETIFKKRNIEPLAGHGSVHNPSITRDEALQVRILTEAFVRLERTLSGASLETAIVPRKKARKKP